MKFSKKSHFLENIFRFKTRYKKIMRFRYLKEQFSRNPTEKQQ